MARKLCKPYFGDEMTVLESVRTKPLSLTLSLVARFAFDSWILQLILWDSLDCFIFLFSRHLCPLIPFLRNFRSVTVLQCPLLTVPSSTLSLDTPRLSSDQSHPHILLLLKKLVWQRPSSLFGPCRTWPMNCKGCMRVCELKVAWVSPHHSLRRESLPAPDLPGG